MRSRSMVKKSSPCLLQLETSPGGQTGRGRCGRVQDCRQLPPPNPEQARGHLLLLQGVLSFGIKTKRTFISTGEARIAAQNFNSW